VSNSFSSCFSGIFSFFFNEFEEDWVTRDAFGGGEAGFDFTLTSGLGEAFGDALMVVFLEGVDFKGMEGD
jgi:hypothetical protein